MSHSQFSFNFRLAKNEFNRRLIKIHIDLFTKLEISYAKKKKELNNQNSRKSSLTMN